MIDENLIREFIAEAEEHLFLLEPNLLRLEKEPDNIELLNEIFLATHGIKGTSSYVGLSHISNFTHTLETLFDRLRKRDIRTSPELIDVLLEGLDMLKLLVSNVSLGKPAPDTSAIEEKLTQWKEWGDQTAKEQEDQIVEEQRTDNEEQLPASESSLLKPDFLKEIDPEDGEIFADIASQQIEFMRLSLDMLRESCLSASLRTGSENHKPVHEQIYSPSESLLKAFHNIQSSAAMLNVEALNTVLEEHARYFSVLENSGYTLTETDITNIDSSIQILEKITKTISVCSPKELQPPEQTSQSVSPSSEPPTFGPSFGQYTLRVNPERIDYLLNLVGELVINRARLLRVSDEIKNLHDDLRTGEASILSTLPTQRKKTVRLFKKLKDTLEEISLDLGRLTDRLQEGTMRIRMIPISQVVNRFPRMVRDLSRQAGKEVTIEIRGTETELDKTVVDVIGDPLIHILRNAIDHGIELPEERQIQGKPLQGKIVLSAYHQGNQVVIEVEDDGKGIDLELVKNKAIQYHLITPQEVNRLQDKEIAALIFRTGFSTVESVSHLSGRGVGLHIVKRYLERLNGAIDFDTTPGKGSKFTIKLPLTLAIIPALMVRVRSEVFAIPLISVEEAIRISEREIKTIESHKVIHLRERILPLVKLADLLSDSVIRTQPFNSFESSFGEVYPERSQGTQDREKFYTVIISDGLREIGLIIDALVGESDIVIKSLDDEFVKGEGVSGASIQGDGKVALVLDAVSLIDLAIKRFQQLNGPKAKRE